MANLHTFRAEFHVHTVLSPCAGVEMIPPLIIAEAEQQGIHLIAITDHNASANTAAVISAAQGTPVHVLPGMELQTVEEVHLLCIFDDLPALQTFQTQVDESLPAVPNNPDFFGEQFVVDASGEFIRREERLLLTSSRFSLEQAVQRVHSLGGLAIPAHINRQAYGLIANLGFIPQASEFDALEISRHLDLAHVPQVIPGARRFPLIQSGDVHYLADFLGANTLTLQAPTVNEIKQAFRHHAGRSLTHQPTRASASKEHFL